MHRLELSPRFSLWHMLPDLSLKIKSGVEPSPQSTQVIPTVPSGSEAVKFSLTSWPGFAGLGETLVIASVGALSFTVSDTVPDPCPALLVAVTLMVGDWACTKWNE